MHSSTVHPLDDQAAPPLYSWRSHWIAALERHSFSTPDRPAIRFQGQTTTWRQLRERSAALADALAIKGVSEGDRVAVVMTNRPEFVESVLAANRLGAIAVPVNFRLTSPEIAGILEDAGATVVILDDGVVTQVAEAVQQMTYEVDLVLVGGRSATGRVVAEDYEELISSDADAHAYVDIRDDLPALLMYTSGTTGRPKGAVLTHLNLQANARNIVRACRLMRDDEVDLCAVPLFHIAAMGSSVAPIMAIGGCLVILPSSGFSSTAVLDLLEAESVSHVFLVPSQWTELCRDPSVPERDLSRLRTISWGASPASTDLLLRMAEVFPGSRNVALFGQTEMSPVTCVLDGADALRKVGSVGLPASNVAVRVVDESMNDVSVGEIGEIVYRGPSLMSGYWRAPEATADAFSGGWFHSGDLVRRDEEGFIYVVDRKKDMLISGGENVYCAEVEDALTSHSEIAEVSIIGRPHERWGETPVAVVVWNAGSAGVTLPELRTWARERLAGYKVPTALEVIDALPRNASGKVVKSVLRARFGAVPSAVNDE